MNAIASTSAVWPHDFRLARRRSASQATACGSSLLHNMSVPADKVVIHHDRRGRLGGRGLSVSTEQLPADRTWGSLLQLFTTEPVAVETVESRLRREILAYAATAGLPQAALVTRQSTSADVVCEDPRLIVCLLAQSSHNIYLRDKEPNLSQLLTERSLILLAFPESSA